MRLLGLNWEKLKGFEVELKVDPDCKPTFCNARPEPYTLNEKIEKELERLVKDASMSQFNILSRQPQLYMY